MFLVLKTNNAYFEVKKQVGEHVEKSPEPRKYCLYEGLIVQATVNDCYVPYFLQHTLQF